MPREKRRRAGDISRFLPAGGEGGVGGDETEFGTGDLAPAYIRGQLRELLQPREWTRVSLDFTPQTRPRLPVSPFACLPIRCRCFLRPFRDVCLKFLAALGLREC